MRVLSWKRILAITLSFIAIGTDAQTGTLSDLGSLLAGQKNLTTFYSLIQMYPAILLKLPSYSGVTILAPSNQAFAKIPYTVLNEAWARNDADTITNVLQYHILQGTRMAASLIPGTPIFIPTLMTDKGWNNVTGGQRVENVKQAGNVVVFVSGQGSRSTLTTADLMFTGGVVQIIDSLLIPPSNFTQTTNAFNLTAFEGACYASKQVETFAAADVTMFAPSNEAFKALGPAVSSMTAEELAVVMDYHLVNDVVYSTGLVNGTVLTTQKGGKLTIRHSGNNVYINSAQLLTTDVLLSNGVLHVIDNVLNPMGPGAEPNPLLPTQVPAFASASAARDIPFMSALPCTTSCPAPPITSQSSTAKVSAKSTSSLYTSAFSTSSSKGVGAPVARETGLGAAGLMLALGGAVMML